MTPSTENRAPNGRFAPGNPGGPGNPHARRVAEVRAALLAAITDDDVHAIARRLIELAKEGDVAAAREVFDRVLGKPQASVSVDLAPAADPMSDRMMAAVIADPELANMASDMLRRAALRFDVSDVPALEEAR